MAGSCSVTKSRGVAGVWAAAGAEAADASCAVPSASVIACSCPAADVAFVTSRPTLSSVTGACRRHVNGLPSRDEVVAMFETAGLRLTAYQRVSHLLAMNWSEVAGKLAMRADSFLARLPDGEFESGMAALRAHACCADPHTAITEDIDFFVFKRWPSCVSKRAIVGPTHHHGTCNCK